MKKLISQPHILVSTENGSHVNHPDFHGSLEHSHESAMNALNQLQPNSVHHVNGIYNGGIPEQSMMVSNPTKEQYALARKIANDQGQDSMLESSGQDHKYVYFNPQGEVIDVKPGSKTHFYNKAPKEGFYSDLNGTFFKHHFPHLEEGRSFEDTAAKERNEVESGMAPQPIQKADKVNKYGLSTNQGRKIQYNNEKGINKPHAMGTGGVGVSSQGYTVRGAQATISPEGNRGQKFRQPNGGAHYDRDLARQKAKNTLKELKEMPAPNLGKSDRNTHVKGVHVPKSNHSQNGGKSAAGNTYRNSVLDRKDFDSQVRLAQRSSHIPDKNIDTLARIKRNQALASHKKVLSDLKHMPAPNLGKNESLKKMSRPVLRFPQFGTDPRAEQQVQPLETGRQKEIYGRKVANYGTPNSNVKELQALNPRVPESKLVEYNTNIREKEGNNIANRFGRNTLGLNALRDPPRSSGRPEKSFQAALTGKLRSKFENFDEGHTEKLGAHRAARNATIKDYNDKMREWRQKGMELPSAMDVDPQDMAEKNKRSVMRIHHQDSRPQMPKLPRAPYKKRVATKDLPREQMAQRGRSIDSAIEHEAGHGIFDTIGQKHGERAMNEAQNSVMRPITDSGAEPFLRNFINKRGYEEKGKGRQTQSSSDRARGSYKEELINHTRDILVNPKTRQDFISTLPANVNPDDVIKNLKRAWEQAYKASKNLTPKQAGSTYMPKSERMNKAEGDFDFNAIAAPPPTNGKKVKQPPIQNLTHHGEALQPNTGLKRLSDSHFDEKKGILHTPKGSVPFFIPKDKQYKEILENPDIARVTHPAISNWLNINRLAQKGQVPDEILAHSNIFSTMSANNPVPNNEMGYAHVRDIANEHGIDVRSPEFREAVAPGGIINEEFNRRNKKGIMPQGISRQYFQDRPEAFRVGPEGSEKRGPNEAIPLGFIDEHLKRLGHHPEAHPYFAEMQRRHGSDAQAMASEIAANNYKSGLTGKDTRLPEGHPAHLPVGLGSKTGRFGVAMAGGGNILVPDTHLIRHAYNMDAAKDAPSIDYLKDVIWNPQNHHILNGMDNYYLKHHPAVKHIQNKYFGGKKDPQSTFPGFWHHWSTIAPHESAMGIGKPWTSKNLTNHQPLFDTYNEILDRHGLGQKFHKSENEPLHVRTAKAHLEAHQKLGEIPAQMFFYSKLAPLLMGSKKSSKKMDKTESLEKAFEPNPKAQAVADSYAKSKGITINHAPAKVKINPEHGKKIANAYEKMKHSPNDPKVKSAYAALAQETGQQFHHLLRNGLKISKMKEGMENPYKTSKDLHNDLAQNNHMWYYPSEQGYGTNEQGSDHPLLKPSKFMHEGVAMPHNDVFRVVHDYFGHHTNGSTFGPKGEHTAYLAHKQMYSPEAQKALASETLGQNSFVNYGPNAEHNKKNPQNTIFAPQKAGLMDDKTINGDWHNE